MEKADLLAGGATNNRSASTTNNKSISTIADLSVVKV
jgi:hypothetical protein